MSKTIPVIVIRETNRTIAGRSNRMCLMPVRKFILHWSVTHINNAFITWTLINKSQRKDESNHVHTYHSRFIHEGVAEASQIFL
jgi:hypothetical protein